MLMRPERSGTWTLPSGTTLAIPAGNLAPRHVPDRDADFLRAHGWAEVPPRVSEVKRTPREVVADHQARVRAEKAGYADMPLDPRTPKVRMLPPVDGPFRALSREGRAYIADGTKPMDVPVADMQFLAANGWIILFTLGLAPDDRPARPKRGDLHLERESLLIFDGRQWRGMHKGAAV